MPGSIGREIKLTYRERLFEVAEEQYGYVTSKDARELGIPVVELAKLAYRGKLTQLRRGVYRFPNTRRTQYDSYYTALMHVSDDAFLIKDAVLSFENLALVNPRSIRVGVTHRIQHEVPTWIKVERYAIDEDEIKIREGIRMTSVAQAIIDSIGIVMPSRLAAALIEAKREGMIYGEEYKRARKTLRTHSPGCFEPSQY